MASSLVDGGVVLDFQVIMSPSSCVSCSYQYHVHPFHAICAPIQRMDYIKLDRPGRTAVIGSGAKLGQIYSTLGKEGFYIPGRHSRFNLP